MRVFGVQGFNEGSWLSGLAKLLRLALVLISRWCEKPKLNATG